LINFNQLLEINGLRDFGQYRP